MRRRASKNLFGKLLFGALMFVVDRLLEPVPALRTVLSVVLFAA